MRLASITLGSFTRTRILPQASDCSVRRSSASSMPVASLISWKLCVGASLNSARTMVCRAQQHSVRHVGGLQAATDDSARMDSADSNSLKALYPPLNSARTMVCMQSSTRDMEE